MAVFRWGRRLPPEALFRLGLDRAPCHAMSHDVFKALEVAAEAVPGAWTRAAGDPDHIALDGAASRFGPRRSRRQRGRASGGGLGQHSLTPGQAYPDTLLALWRAHRLIENRLHWRREVIRHEDHSRSCSGPQTIAALRNAMLQLGREATAPLAETRAIFAENRHAAIKVPQTGLL